MAAPAPGVPRSPGILAPIGAVGLTAACYLNVLSGGLVWDDRVLVLGAEGRGGSLLSVFRQPFLQFWGYYRPLTSLSFVLQAGATGTDPVPFHIVNVVAHLVNVMLVYGLARRFGASSLRAAVAAAGWGIFPRLTESVGWISGRTDVFATLCVLAALLTATVESSPRRVAAAAWLGAGLLFKEVALAGVPALAALELRRVPGSGRQRLKGVVLRLVPVTAVVATYLAARAAVLPAGQWSAGGVVGFRRATLPLQSVGTYVTMALSPLGPTTFVGDKGVPSPSLEVLGAIAVVIVAAAIARGLWRWPPGVLASAVVSGAALLPVMHLTALPIPNVACDRYLYLPLAGLVVALAVGLPSVRSANGRRLVAFGVGGAVALFSVATVRRNRVYDDEVAFWIAALDPPLRDPVFAWIENAEVLFRAGRFGDSAMLRIQLLLTPNALSAAKRRDQQVMAAVCFAEAGRWRDARWLLDERLAAEPASAALRTNAAVIELRRLDFTATRRELAIALRLDPGFPAARSLLARVDRVEGELKTLEASGAPGGREPGVLAQRARILEQVGMRDAVEAWSIVAETESEPANDRRSALRFLVRHGPVLVARRAFEKARIGDHEYHGLAELGQTLAKREASEKRLDLLVSRLGLDTIQ